MPWQRPNIGSRVTREGHARFWGRPEVKLPGQLDNRVAHQQVDRRCAEFPDIAIRILGRGTTTWRSRPYVSAADRPQQRRLE